MQTSNIAQPTATSASGWPRWLPAGLIAAVVYVSFQPFADGSSVSGGNIVNQIGFLAIGAACCRLLFLMGERARAALLQPAWLAVALALLAAIAQADDSGGSFRAALFSAIVVLAAGTAMAWPRTRGEMTATLGFGATIALGFSYVAVFIFPEVGVHDGSGFEAQHAGLWRGTYPHKNVASYVTGAFVIVGLFMAANGRAAWGLALAVLALVFTVQAGSKTVLGVLPVAIGMSWFASRFHNGLVRAFFVLLPLALLMTATLGAAFSTSVNDTLQAVAPGTTFTGRLDLWTFTLEQIAKRPWTGYGFESFWTTPRVTGLEQPIELSWDVREIVHGHNSYLDAIVAFGAVGGAVVLWVVVLRPVWHFANLPGAGRGPSASFAQLCISLWLLCAMGACLESFFLRRSDPVWFTMALALFGLQIARVRTRDQSAAIASGESSSTTASAREKD